MNTPKLRNIPSGKERQDLSFAEGWVNEIKNSVNKVYILYGSLDQLKGSPLFMGFLKENMVALQKEGKYGFTDALMQVAKKWNHSPAALFEGFRMTTNLGPTKSYRISGRLIKAENKIFLQKVLKIDDYKTESICKALGFTVRELWPVKILGKNATSERMRGDGNYRKWWDTHGREAFLKLKAKGFGDRDAVRKTLQDYNKSQSHEFSRLQIGNIYEVFSHLFKPELALAETHETLTNNLNLAFINKKLGIRIVRNYLVEKQGSIFLNTKGLEYFASKKGGKILIGKFQEYLKSIED